MKPPLSFVLSEQHIKLLRASYVCWLDIEFGAPSIDPKRPYGNSSVYPDIAEILGIEFDYDDESPETDKKMALMQKIHMDLKIALQIVLVTGKFEPGVYRQTAAYDVRSWVKEA